MFFKHSFPSLKVYDNSQLALEENKNISNTIRLHITILGAVQGVGFRPFVYKLADSLGLVGWVNNSTQGVLIEVEGSKLKLETFLKRLEQEKPSCSFIQSLESQFLDPVGYTRFEFRSSSTGEKTALVLPDIAICSECLQEIFEPTNRRHRYPFTNCTNCGPRFSIIQALPYDRHHTTMHKFKMCERCQAEYSNPLNRRFHAQPNACPDCGPYLELWDKNGKVLASHEQALLSVAEAIRQGAIAAIKGLGGFHLMVDARNQKAVQRLRQLKHREEKPFALMYPALELVKQHCEVSELEERLLRSPAAPIVLLRRQKYLNHRGTEDNEEERKIEEVCLAVAPNNPYLGVMLPYTPLHHLLMAELGFPVVATSGNLSDEPICTDEHDALQRLSGIADLFLVHNRLIARPVDDSIVRVMMGREMVMRRARGYAPLPISCSPPLSIPSSPVLAVGGHLKNAIAFSVANQVFVSQHIGDLETVGALNNFKQVIASFQQLYDFQPTAIACDLHPDYLSTQYARTSGIQVIPVQHHYAHVLACMADNQLTGSAIGVAWDGTGYGLDGTIWGGEFLQIRDKSWQRLGHLRTFRLPGGEKAIKEPRRAAIGLLYELFGEAVFEMKHLAPIRAFSKQELAILKTMFQRNINTPITSSAGRLFDAIASLIGIRQQKCFEGQAAMELEFALADNQTDEQYNFDIYQPGNIHSSPIIIDWALIVKEILVELSINLPIAHISAKFHNTMVELVIALAKLLRSKSSNYLEIENILLTGGCFQNKYLTERAIRRLQNENFKPYWHQRIPPNDGSIALGQIIAASLH